MISKEMESQVDFCKRSAVEAMEYFLNTFSFVPDEKLTWTPTPSAKSPIRIAAHTALYAGRFARMIADPSILGRVNLAERNAAEAAITSRAEVESVFRKGTDELLAVLDSMTPEAVESILDSGFGGSMPMIDLMNQPAFHANSHAAQIDYLQTCWDDQEVHF
jgi:hypothetical protein